MTAPITRFEPIICRHPECEEDVTSIVMSELLDLGGSEIRSRSTRGPANEVEVECPKGHVCRYFRSEVYGE